MDSSLSRPMAAASAMSSASGSPQGLASGIPEGGRHGVAQRVAIRASAVHSLSLVHVRLDAHTLRHKLRRQRRLEAATLGWQGGRWLSGGSSSSER